MASDPSPRVPQKVIRIGPYEVVSLIAQGGMGAVYRARDTETGRDVALKALTPAMAAKPAMRERFYREAGHAANLRHENIVKSYPLIEQSGTFFMPMEFVDGVDLLKYIEEKQRLDPEETRQIMLQACRALKHAHENGLVHRDVKPSNFMLTKKGGRLIVKLTDFGLARDPDSEARMTTEGTTVGTIDYMSPEQARDSGLADIRSDLYSLGCTWFHMLAGKAPFPEGGLGERIVKHMHEKPPDVRRFNPRASKALSQVLYKLLAKDPKDRYQTPAELIEVLHELDPIAKSPKVPTAQTLTEDEEDEAAAASSKRAPAKRKSKKGRRGDGDTIADRAATIQTRSPRRTWLWLGAAGVAGTLLFGMVGLVVVLKVLNGHSLNASPAPSDAGSNSPVVVRPTPEVDIKPNTEIKTNPSFPQPLLPALYDPIQPINVVELRQRIDAAFPKIEPVKTDAPLRVKRAATGEDGTTFGTLIDALAKTPPGHPAVIEIQDNGPLFWSTMSISGRDVTIRAAKGYRPLIVWDVQRTLQERGGVAKPEGGKPLHFLTLERGRLHLEGVDVVLQWPANLTAPLALVQATDADFSADHCTFSLSGKHTRPVVVARLLATGAETHRCRFLSCALRGESLQALDLTAPGSQGLFEKCLVAGGTFPLLQLHCSTEQLSTLYVVRSTLVAAESLLHVQSVPTEETSPALKWLSWDSILSRSSEKSGGELLVLPPNASVTKFRWEEVNTLYAGWQTLLTGVDPVRFDEPAKWRRLMKCIEGDRAIAETWPAARADFAEVGTELFNTTKTPVCFAASVKKEDPIGCDLAQLPPLRENWIALAYDRVARPSFHVLNVAAPPEIPASNGTIYTGQVLELTPAVDLGHILQEMQHTRHFGPKVVLHLKGSGVQKMTPVKLKDVHLTLFFEQPAMDEAKRLVLTLPPNQPGTTLPDAMIEIEGGGLDVLNGDFFLPDLVGQPVTATLFKVSGGDLRLHRCRLTGPYLFATPSNYRGLIQFDGSGKTAIDKAGQCIVNESVLLTDKTAIHLRGIGSRLLVKQSVVVSGGQVLHLELGSKFKGRANVQGVFESASVAGRRSVVLLDDAMPTEGAPGPIVLQSAHTAFLCPFPERNNNAGMLRYGGDALAHGLLLWQSDGDLLDARYRFGVQSVAVDPPKAEVTWQAAWKILWGFSGVQRANTDAVLRRQFDVGKPWALEQLLLTGPNMLPLEKPPCGADLIGNGFLRKRKGP